MSKPRDTQRQKVYKWGWALGMFGPDDPKVTLAEAQTLANEACGRYGLKRMPEVTDGRGRQRGAYSPGRHAIKLPVRSRTRMVVLHEAAHAIVEAKQVGKAWHGPEFARVQADLFARYAKISPATIRNEAKKAGVKLASVADAPAPPRPPDKTERLLREKVASLRAELQATEGALRAYLTGKKGG